MKLYIFSIRDIKADQFANPFCAVAPGAAIRGFSDAVNGKDEMLAAHPGDFELYMLGTFDTDSAEFEIVPREQKAIGSDLVVKKGSF